MKYVEIHPISRDDAEQVFRSGDSEDIPLTLVRLAYHEKDWEWVQSLCISLSSHEDMWIRGTCATCFGHIARIHGKIDARKVMPVLERLLLDPEVVGEAQDALDDIHLFAKQG